MVQKNNTVQSLLAIIYVTAIKDHIKPKKDLLFVLSIITLQKYENKMDLTEKRNC